MILLMRFLSGFVTFRISGSRPGAFVNELIRRGFNVWGITARGGEIVCCVRLSDYRSVQRLCRGRSQRVHIVRRTGLPFIVLRNRRRSGLALGAVLFLVIFRLLSLFIWTIDLCEFDTISRTAALDILERVGMYEGVRADFESLKRMQTTAMLEFGNLSWITINADGSFGEVNATEKLEPETNDTAPRNMKASADGQVVRADAYAGAPCVGEGDAVVKGSLLISGFVETELGGVHLERADGVVIAKTHYTETLTQPKTYRKASPEQNCARRYSAKLFGVTLPLTLHDAPPEYLSFKTETAAEFYGSRASASLIEERLYAYAVTEHTLTKDEALTLLHDKAALRELLRYSGKTIAARREKLTETADAYTLTLEYDCEENIAAPSPINADEFTIRQREEESAPLNE